MSTDVTRDTAADEVADTSEGFVDVSNEKLRAAFKLGLDYATILHRGAAVIPDLASTVDTNPAPTALADAAEEVEQPKRAWWLGDRGCPPWCEEVDLHRNYDEVGHRTHVGDVGGVPMSMYAGSLLAKDGFVRDMQVQDDDAQPHELNLVLEQNHYAREPVVRVSTIAQITPETPIELTLDEAQELGRALLDAATTGRSTGRRRSRSKDKRRQAAFRSGYQAAVDAEEQRGCPVAIPGLAAVLAARQERYRRHFALGYLSRLAGIDEASQQHTEQ